MAPAGCLSPAVSARAGGSFLRRASDSQATKSTLQSMLKERAQALTLAQHPTRAGGVCALTSCVFSRQWSLCAYDMYAFTCALSAAHTQRRGCAPCLLLAAGSSELLLLYVPPKSGSVSCRKIDETRQPHLRRTKTRCALFQSNLEENKCQPSIFVPWLRLSRQAVVGRRELPPLAQWSFRRNKRRC